MLTIRQSMEVTSSAALHSYAALSSAIHVTTIHNVLMSARVSLSALCEIVVSGAVAHSALRPLQCATDYLIQVTGYCGVAAQRAMSAAQVVLVSTASSIAARQALADSVTCMVSSTSVIGITTYQDANDERTMRLADEGRVMTIRGER